MFIDQPKFLGFSKCNQAIWESYHISECLSFSLWLCMACKQTVKILFHNQVTLNRLWKHWAERCLTLYFLLKKKNAIWEQETTCTRWLSGLKTALEVIQNVETAQCISVPSTASHHRCSNTELIQCLSQTSMSVKFRLYRKKVHVQPKQPKKTSCLTG